MVVQQDSHDKRNGQLCPYAWLVEANNSPQIRFLGDVLPVAGSGLYLTAATLWSVSAIQVGGCPGFGWDKVNSLPSSWYSAVFWIKDENNVDNTLMF